MTLPGVTFGIGESVPPRSIPRGVDRWFAVGMADRGPVIPAKITSLESFKRVYGPRVSYGYLYDAADVFFREGGSELWVSRVVGPSAVTATVNLFDVAGSTTPGDVSLRVDARNAGAWGNDVKVAVEAGTGGGFVIVLTNTAGLELDRSPSLADTDEAVAWSATSDYITLTKGAGALENPRVAAAASLTTGADDRANALDTHWATALDRFSLDLGSGQVSMPGRTTDDAWAAIIAHAITNNRIPILDGVDTADKATLIASATTARAITGNGPRFTGVFAPWAIVPGELPGTTRTVPYSAVQAGLIARSDNAGNSPNTAAAGDNGISRYAIGLSQAPWSDTDREALNDAGVNVARMLYGAVTTYGYRTLANPITDKNWLYLSGSREIAFILSEAQIAGEALAFDNIDPQGKTLSAWQTILTAICDREYKKGALFGASAEEAYSVNTGAQVNTPTTIADGRVLSVLGLKTSPLAEQVEVVIVKVPTLESV